MHFELGYCSSTWSPSITSIGNLGFRPNINRYGICPVDSNLVQLYEWIIGLKAYQFCLWCDFKGPSMFNIVQLNLSHMPFPIGWQLVVLDFFIPVSWQSSLITLLSKLVPWSEWILLGIPYYTMEWLKKASASWFLVGMAWAYLA